VCHDEVFILGSFPETTANGRDPCFAGQSFLRRSVAPANRRVMTVAHDWRSKRSIKPSTSIRSNGLAM
jgi:hypothetical protein